MQHTGHEGGTKVWKSPPEGQSLPDLCQPALSEGHPGTVHSHSGPQDKWGTSNPPPSAFWENAAPPAETQGFSHVT